MMSGLCLVGMPIGNYDDLAQRGLECLKKAALILCEDTRESAKMLLYYGMQTRLVSYVGDYENAVRLAHEAIKKGHDVALICDRGMPCISDPGARVVEYFRKVGVKIDCIPGASSVTTAFALSGFHGGFVFHGFLPRKKGDILKVAEQLAVLDYNLIFFESPRRMHETLELLNQFFADRTVVLAKDLTKKYQQVVSGKIVDLLKQKEFLGEYVIVVGRI